MLNKAKFISAVDPHGGAPMDVSEKVFRSLLEARGWRVASEESEQQANDGNGDKSAALMLETRAQLVERARSLGASGISKDTNKSELVRMILEREH